MSGIQPVAVYAMRVPPGNIMVPAVPEFAAMFRLTMAAIDPSEEVDAELADGETIQPRATLKLVRVPDDMFGDSDSDEDDEDYSDEDEEDSEDDEEAEGLNGGPSNPKKSKQSKKAALLEALAQDQEEDDEDESMDEEDAAAEAEAILKLQKAMKSAKGKGKAAGDEEMLDDEDSDDSDDAIELDEIVLCTLDPTKQYQQTLDFVVGEGEKVFFKVSGTHTVHLTGNYVIPEDDGQASLYDEDEEDEEYDLSPDEDELDGLEALVNGGDESDELDDLDDPRVMEVDSEEDAAPKLVKAAGKGKNKRPAEDSDDEANLDAIMAKSLKKDDASPAAAASEEKKLSKTEKKKLKKLKNNEGEAATAPTTATPKAATSDKAQTNGTEKKVQFAKNLEQGPTPSATPPTSSKSADKSKPTATPTTTTTAAQPKKSPSISIREVQGVVIDDRKIGSGPAAKKGSKLEMRYIGKLDDNKVFDSNKSGKPFSFKLGAGDVIKGWDIGMEGIQVGGERRIIVPAKLAYGNKALPGIPANSRLTFDIKCLTVK